VDREQVKAALKAQQDQQIDKVVIEAFTVLSSQPLILVLFISGPL
jgi:hypothetical protein